MAGSGKTTLIQRINSYLHQHKKPGYIINLDPAVTHVPYEANIDIRDTVRRRDARACAAPARSAAYVRASVPISQPTLRSCRPSNPQPPSPA